MGRAAGAPPRRRAGRRPGRLRVRAEDRRRRHLAALRGRPARAGGHPGRRAGGRGRHRQRRHHRGDPATRCRQGRARRARGAGRGLHAAPALRGAQRAPGRGRRAARSSTRATRRPARCARRTRRSPRAASSRSGATSSARSSGGPAFTSHHETLDFLRGARPAGQPRDHACCRTSTRCTAYCRALAAAPPRPRLRDRRRGREGRRPRPARRARLHQPRRRGGPSPTSSRPRSAPRSCSTSSCRSAAPAGPRRSPCSSRCSSAASTVGPGHAAQRGPGAGQGRAPGRHGDRAPGRRRDPRGRRPGAGRAHEAAPSRGRSRPTCPCPASSRSCGPRARATPLRQPRSARASSPARIEHFASRGAMDIEGFGEQRVRLLPRARARRTTSATSSPRLGPGARARGLRRDLGRQPPARPSTRRRQPPARQPAGRPQHPPPRAGRGGGAGRGPSATSTAIMDAAGRRAWPRRRRGPVIAAGACTSGSPTPAQPRVIEKLRAAGVNFVGPGARRRAADPRRASRSSSPARSRATPGRRPRRPSRPRGGKSPGQRVEEDHRGRGRRGPGRVEAHQGRGARRPDPRRGRASTHLLETGELPGGSSAGQSGRSRAA